MNYVTLQNPPKHNQLNSLYVINTFILLLLHEIILNALFWNLLSLLMSLFEFFKYIFL